jgi:hypothetical protein
MRKRSLLMGIVSLFAGLASAPSALAWNATGHMMVAKQAWDEMTPETRAKATTILRQLPHYEVLLSHMPKDYTDPDAFAFMEASTWPDNIRSNNHPSHAEHHGVWHYVDYPMNPEHVEADPAPVEHWDGTSDPANLLQALEKNEKELADPNTPGDRRAIALCWVLHLVGDIHQPLHATSLFGKKFPTGDKGGNSFLVKGPQGNTGLHSLWDNMMGISRNPFVVEKLLAELKKDPKVSREAMKDRVAVREPAGWAKESYELAAATVYDNAQLAGTTKELLTKDSEAPPLPVGYMEKGHEVAGQRIMLGGHRLADVMEATVGK